MPVILELEEYEADLVVDALMEGRIRLMKDWGDRWRSPDRSPFEDDLAHIDADIVAVADIRERLKEGIMWQRFCQERSADPEKRVSVAWHHERGWLPSADFIEKPIEGSLDQDQMSPDTWTTLPDDVAVDDWMFDITDPEELKVKRIEIKIDGVTRTVYSIDRNIEALERALVDLQKAQRAYLGGCVS
ncbi:hypothetical protein CN065_14175 [Sinorhizobium meliloti]|uniref:hypothetical protein n=1 Tax=Rhizobium meliloti TaxID=382 RepID=UPI000B49A368|nr:hypothetical protein [Sinorhizobium meliloti]ASP98426.1 hypothetical protein CDO24_13885 [Sinorhizobium meliloti]MQV66171.1 hypothetical protein [Sinorhizobium meliloti]RVQ39339.1 hypothetical protein CN065_14175 [Sinorhizobium meliloti]